MPNSTEVTYLIESSAQALKDKTGGEETKEEDSKATVDETSTIFCLDISGSMNAQVNVPGANMFGMTRLSCGLAAIRNQITQLGKGAGEQTIGIVTFGSEVFIHGDCMMNTDVIPSHTINNFEGLQAYGKQQAKERMREPLKTTKDVMLGKLAQIHTTGATCLGPAVLTSVAMAAQGKPGSQVVLVTDG